jgi:hypothetical protein
MTAPLNGIHMPEISNKTMCIAIQAVAAEIRSLRDLVQSGEGVPEDAELLESYQAAADDLERAYDKAAETVLNLPPYEDLVGAG